MKKKLKGALSLLLCMIMLFGAVGGEGIGKLFSDTHAEAANNSSKLIKDFLKNKEYSSYTKGFEDSTLEYAILDVNSDSIPELFIHSTYDRPFFNTWIFILKDDKVVLIKEEYGYGDFSYSSSENLLLGVSETRPSSTQSYSPFYRLSGSKLELVFSVGVDDGQPFYRDSNGKKSISSSEKNAFYYGFIDFSWSSIDDVAEYGIRDIIEFGSYPQSEVTKESDSATYAKLEAASKNWVSYGYYSGDGSYGSMKQGDWMQYADISLGGAKYRAVRFTQYRPYYTEYSSSPDYSYQDDNGYTVNNIYYFKYEPLKWQVLDPTKGLVLSKSIIDSQAYSNTIYENGTDAYGYTAYWNNASYTKYANDYATSSIRKWLNEDFYNTAFTSSQKQNILPTTLDNSAYSTDYSKYDSVSTTDNVFLLSYSEAQNTSYGFTDNTSSTETRKAVGTDYAKAQGLWVYSSNKCSYWRLRSAGSNYDYACRVSLGGDVSGSDRVDDTNGGVRPALRLSDLASDIFESEIGDVASPTGTKVSMVGKHFYANIGESELSLSPGGKATGNQATCYVPVGSPDLDFTFESGDKNILTIGDTDVSFYGVYFIKFNVFGISEGTTTVTVRTSDGASSTAIVTVAETPTSSQILKGEGKLPADAKILAGTMDDYVTAVILNGNGTYVSDVIIDKTTYPIQRGILPDATIEMMKGKPVIAVIQGGKITEIDLIENYITASVSTNFIDGTAIKDGDTHLVTASVSNTLPSRLMGADLSSLSEKFKIKINSVSIKIGSESVYSGNPYAEIGVDGFKIVASKEVKIKKSFANFNGEADIKVVVTGERNGTPLSLETKSSIKILSKSEWNKISESANKKKTEKQYDNEIKATVAKNSKNLKLDETIAWNATLGEFMSKKQLSALGYAMVGTIVMAEAPKATFTEYLTAKMLDKLGVAHKIAAGAFSVDVPMTVKIKTYKYGELVIDFEAHATNYTLGGKSYGSFGDVTYEITGGSGLSKVPTSMRSGLAGAIAYADVNTFADAMYDIALAEVKKAYNLGYGNDFNTVCDVFFNDTIVDVMLSACKTDYKGAFFDIISYPARQYKGACPIEMRVYDPSNELCGFVSDSKAVSTDENVECTVEGHTKIITVYGYKANDFKVEITATGSGVMNLEASDYAGSCRKLGSQTFTDFPIECGKTYSYICGAVSLDESSKDMITDGSNKVYADDITIFERADIEATEDKYTIVFWSADGSKIIGLYELLPGESIPSIEAPKKVGYDFVGWANENGKIEEIPSTMPASERSFTAVFEPIKTKLTINTPSTTTVSYGFTLNLHANVTDLPEGARVVWSMDGSGFELIPSADGMTCGVKSVSKGSATITAKVIDKSGNAVKDANGNEITASQQLTSKAGFFQKLVAFFKKLFGSNMVIPSSLNKLVK